MKRILLLFFCMHMVLCAKADTERFSVLTCSPGDEAYSLFGHTALRYVNEEKKVDVVFNYGYFDFNSPGFMWRFALGETDYRLGAVPFRFFIPEYVDRGSSITEQILDLTPEQVERLLNALVENNKPENRVFRYNYFYKNCTTMARDKFLEIVSGDSKVVFEESGDDKSFRDELNRMTADHPWFAFGINVILGSDVDATATKEELQFVPSNLMNDLDKAYIVDSDGNRRPLVKEKRVLVHENKPKVEQGNFTPFYASLLLLLLTMIVMLCELRRKKTFWGYDIILMLMQGVAGLGILFMWIFSEHPAVGSNYAILLLNPLALIVMPVMVYRIIKHKSPVLAWVQVGFVSLFFLTALFGLQVYPVPLYFCAVTILVRSLFHIYKDRICELNIV
ncbi:MAG: DUF4105 domain-containing protein [Bacteroidaceae bacterium]|nr:DUF4105 domain-containing protein [Bacteroidaceae bacterium]